MTVISSTQNRYVKLYRSLEKRKIRIQQNLVPLEGEKLIRDAIERRVLPEVVYLREGLTPEEFPFLQALESQVPVLSIAEKLFDRTAFTDSPQGILAVAPRPKSDLTDLFVKKPALLLVADGVQDPGNLGTMLRSAAAAGADGAILLPGTVDATNPKALRAAMGAYFALSVVETNHQDCLSALAGHGVSLVTTAARAEVAYDRYDWNTPVAVVIGNEGSGVSPAMAEAAKSRVSIPMAGAVESLNAAIAMSVIFFEAARQRRKLV
ncbi:TrmH family RNA methyltransferase [Dethiobacter alkaliphilus]|uniref:tRNA/rRNA methyltransferase (SpoU) n=1 Tax=Dethiobacter alkaliphilus AHT 1 TaxID=555088 RepID=C0GJM5_DETAL|nr:RNA methyltransferase [Dethiobacter alkaliphilus]EEG76447.1 tRNA/rRNA methyltransferase (SpoU) [Dethiobacter alkaliphilus AHT 1]